MNVLLVDDEPLARLRLRALLDALPDLGARVVGEAGNAEEALALLQTTVADVVLLDIRMPGRDGLRLSHLLQALPQPPAVIFVTAHAEHALRAFELQAVDYLTKPVRSDRLRMALQRVRPRAPGAGGLSPEGPVLVVSDRGRVLRLPLADVLVLKAEQKYVSLHTPSQLHVLDEALSDLAEKLAALGGDFIRIHRNALVARRAVRALALRHAKAPAEAVPEDLAEAVTDAGGNGWAVRVAPLDEWLAVSRRQVAAVRAALHAAPAAPATHHAQPDGA